MKKFTEFEKLSKKEQKRINNSRRGSWGDCNPVTKVVKSKKVYSRKTKHKSANGCDDYR